MDDDGATSEGFDGPPGEANAGHVRSTIEQRRVHSRAETRGAISSAQTRATLATVTDQAMRILEAAMQLSDAERAALAVVLKDSVGDGSSPDEIEAAWIAEVERRRGGLRSGRTTAVPWQEVRREIFDMIERARDRQAIHGAEQQSMPEAQPAEQPHPAIANAYRERVVAKVERSLTSLDSGRGVPHAEVQAQLEARYAISPGDRQAALAIVTDEADRVLDAALELPEAQRAELAAILTDSIGDGSSPEGVEAYWIAEAKRRIAAVERGEITPVPLDEAMQRLRSKVRCRRERQAPTVVAKIERGIADVQAGRVVPHAEVMAMIEQRYPASGQGSAATEVEAERAAFVAAVEVGLADIEAGRVHTHAEVHGAMAARFDGLDRATLADVTDEADRILDAALQLPERERAELAVMLTDSIGDGSSPEEVRASWLAEVQRRREALARGEETLVDFDDMMARLRAKVHRSRERRASTG